MQPKMKLLFIAISTCAALFQNTLQAENYQRSYAWNFNGKNFTTTLSFDEADYLFYKKVKRNYTDFSFYMKENASHQILNQVAFSLKKIAVSNKYTEWQSVEFVSAFVQYLNYKDDGYYEYPRFPLETLTDKAGDCEDTAILLAALLHAMGYETVLISPKGHMGCGIAVKEKINGNAFPYQGNYYYYIETTSGGWGIGDYPEHLSDAVTIFDAGLDEGKILSKNNTSTMQNEETIAQSSNQNKPVEKTTAQQKDAAYTKTEEVNSEETFQKASYTYAPSYTVDEDVIIINGEKETLVTKATYNGDEFEITATNKK